MKRAALAQDKYFEGKQCKHGHGTRRFVSTRKCVECCALFEAKPHRQERRALWNASAEGKARKREWQSGPAGKAWSAAAKVCPVRRAIVAAHDATPKRKAGHAARHHWRTYGEPIEARFERFAQQGSRDDLSGQEAAIADMNQDHDHVTGKLRGLISRANNHALGNLADSPVRAVQAARYLIRHAAADPEHPLLTDQTALRDAKAEAERLIVEIDRLMRQQKQEA